jgi:8-oxo-dGTP pyrophosphatase MutT (NUDIX family)
VRSTEWQEFFTVVGRENRDDPRSPIVAAGCVLRKVAHSAARVPHATVQIIPIRRDTDVVILHQRPGDVLTCPGMWDFLGGHVTFEMSILHAPDGLATASALTALREAREEMLVTVDARVHLIEMSHLRQIGDVGQFDWGVNDPCATNVEYSTAFVLCLPKQAEVEVVFERQPGGQIQRLAIAELSWCDLLQTYQAGSPGSPSPTLNAGQFRAGFADGAARILDGVLIDTQICQEVQDKLGCYS